MTLPALTVLEERLNDFKPSVRRDALAALDALTDAGLPPAGGNVNMHCHSFFSYNALGHSPTRIAWEARKSGLYAAALCDFDVLDGLDEFLDASNVLALRASVHLETRAFLEEYAEYEINSPGEPGVTYIMGGGFFASPAKSTPQAKELTAYHRRARRRNEALVRRINEKLPDIALDYERDVVPLTPLGGATERHIIKGYINRAETVMPTKRERVPFWAELLETTRKEADAMLRNLPDMEGAVRSRLAKRGGLGYEQPSSDTFPSADDFVAWVRSCGAIPRVTWLDGTSEGESRCREMLELLASKGCAGLNIIPDRNWNIKDTGEKALKVGKLDEIVREAEKMEMPINIGTEMNKLGLPFVDDLDGEVLSCYRDIFLKGARIMVGHTILARYADMPYLSEAADATFKSVTEKNRFFEAVGGMEPFNRELADRFDELGPEKTLSELYDGLA
jgi:hypothetical protein